jgi:hypothetical protein
MRIHGGAGLFASLPGPLAARHSLLGVTVGAAAPTAAPDYLRLHSPPGPSPLARHSLLGVMVGAAALSGGEGGKPLPSPLATPSRPGIGRTHSAANPFPKPIENDALSAK